MTNADLIAISSVLGVLVLGLFAYALLTRESGSRKKIRSRVEELADLDPSTAQVDAESLFRDLSNRQRGLMSDVADWLRPIGGAQAMRPLALIGAASAAIGFLIAHQALSLSGPILFLMPLGLGIAVPYFYIGHLKEQRQLQFLDAFPDAIDLVVRAVRAGIPASEALSMAGRDLPGPVATELLRIAEEIAIGINPEVAISEAATRVRLPDFSFFAVTLILQRETGGNLAETLDGLSQLLRKRKEMRMKVRALTAEGRFTSKVIALLPVLIVVALYFLNREYVILLFTDPVGQLFLGGATALVVIGSIILGRMVKLEV